MSDINPKLRQYLECVEETQCAVLTETNTTKVKLGKGNRPSVEIAYKILERVVNISAITPPEVGHTQIHK